MVMPFVTKHGRKRFSDSIHDTGESPSRLWRPAPRKRYAVDGGADGRLVATKTGIWRSVLA